MDDSLKNLTRFGLNRRYLSFQKNFEFHAIMLSSLHRFDVIADELYDQASKAAYAIEGMTNKSTTHLASNYNRPLNSIDLEILANIFKKASSVFEFGVGESTLIASDVNVPRYAGIDND